MLDNNNNYIWQVDVSDTDVDIEIQSSLWQVKFKSIKTTKSIVALSWSWIEAWDGIKAWWGINAWLHIICKWLLKFQYNLFAWTAARKKVEKWEDTKIECGKLEGNVVYWDVVELWIPTETVSKSFIWKEVTFTIDWKEYTAVIQ